MRCVSVGSVWSSPLLKRWPRASTPTSATIRRNERPQLSNSSRTRPERKEREWKSFHKVNTNQEDKPRGRRSDAMDGNKLEKVHGIREIFITHRPIAPRSR